MLFACLNVPGIILGTRDIVQQKVAPQTMHGSLAFAEVTNKNT